MKLFFDGHSDDLARGKGLFRRAHLMKKNFGVNGKFLFLSAV
jgi:hypothetical protein